MTAAANAQNEDPWAFGWSVEDAVTGRADKAGEVVLQTLHPEHLAVRGAVDSAGALNVARSSNVLIGHLLRSPD